MAARHDVAIILADTAALLKRGYSGIAFGKTDLAWSDLAPAVTPVNTHATTNPPQV
jgi:hypothetical protein